MIDFWSTPLGRLYCRLPVVRRLIEANEGLAREREVLLDQRDTLESERDELAAHTSRLSEEIAASLERERLCTARIESLQVQRDALERLMWAPPGHFYSPIVNPDDRHVLGAVERHQTGVLETCGDLDLRETEMLQLFGRLAVHHRDIPFPRSKSPGFRYYFDNPAFSYADAITLFGFLREFRPKRVVEVGSGFSSCVMMDTNDLCLSGSVDLTFIDPFPGTLFSLLADDDPYRERVQAIALQDTPLSLFSELEEDDILFIDSSHVAKTGSDVVDYMFRVLPALGRGVLVHIHDLPYPFEYPAAWIAEQNRSWNEAFLVRAFLQYNSAFEPLFFNDFIYRKHADLTRREMPLCLDNTGGSLWLRKTR